jgi:hypothetical protein
MCFETAFARWRGLYGRFAGPVAKTAGRPGGGAPSPAGERRPRTRDALALDGDPTVALAPQRRRELLFDEGHDEAADLAADAGLDRVEPSRPWNRFASSVVVLSVVMA